jgi:glucan phosphoethanolaminetransferase (alkaline phosphatase superfamily)
MRSTMAPGKRISMFTLHLIVWPKVSTSAPPTRKFSPLSVSLVMHIHLLPKLLLTDSYSSIYLSHTIFILYHLLQYIVVYYNILHKNMEEATTSTHPSRHSHPQQSRCMFWLSLLGGLMLALNTLLITFLPNSRTKVEDMERI